MFSSFNALKREIKGQVITQIYSNYSSKIFTKKITTSLSFKNPSTFLES